MQFPFAVLIEVASNDSFQTAPFFRATDSGHKSSVSGILLDSGHVLAPAHLFQHNCPSRRNDSSTSSTALEQSFASKRLFTFKHVDETCCVFVPSWILERNEVFGNCEASCEALPVKKLHCIHASVLFAFQVKGLEELFVSVLSDIQAGGVRDAWEYGWRLSGSLKRDSAMTTAADPAALSTYVILRLERTEFSSAFSGAHQTLSQDVDTLSGSYASVELPCPKTDVCSLGYGSGPNFNEADYLQLHCTRNRDDEPEQTLTSEKLYSIRVHTGQAVMIVGSPFGCLAPSHFYNACVQGIVSRVVNIKSSTHLPYIFFLDAHLMPGMEGGPVYSAQNGNLLGVVSVPLVRRSDGTQMHMAVPWVHILDTLRSLGFQVNQQQGGSQMHDPDAIISSPFKPHQKAVAGIFGQERQPLNHSRITPAALSSQQEHLLHQHSSYETSHRLPGSLGLSCSTAANVGSAVVLVRCGTSWASGVLIRPSGMIITCAHLLPAMPDNSSSRSRDYPACSVRCIATDGSITWHPSRVIYAFTRHLDLAVLQMSVPAVSGSSAVCAHLELAPEKALRPGMPVVVAGHGLLGPAIGWPCALTAGSVARVVCAKGRPSMIITSAAVYGGSSGGAVVDAATGHLLGMVTSNARHASGETLPHFNFVLAAAELEEVVAALKSAELQPRDHVAITSLAERLREIDERSSDEANRLWALLPPLSSSRTNGITNEGFMHDEGYRSRL